MRLGRTKGPIRYFDFLYKVGFDDSYHKELAGYLNSIPYEYLLDRDENRMYDGMDMRREFMDLAKGDERWIFKFGKSAVDSDSVIEGGACTMLEFLVGFAYRLTRDMFNDGDLNTSDLVKIMLEGMDIWQYDDSEWSVVAEDRVEDALDIFMDREYEYDGSNGNIFVIPGCNDDLREVELWVQASWWYNYYSA